MNIIEFKGNERFDEWIHENDRPYRIIRVTATNLSSNSWPALGSAFIHARTFTVTYEDNDLGSPSRQASF